MSTALEKCIFLINRVVKVIKVLKKNKNCLFYNLKLNLFSIHTQHREFQVFKEEFLCFIYFHFPLSSQNVPLFSH